ncbi:hypothetical protein Tco_1457999 [Tanacetum coccineum]
MRPIDKVPVYSATQAASTVLVIAKPLACSLALCSASYSVVLIVLGKSLLSLPFAYVPHRHSALDSTGLHSRIQSKSLREQFVLALVLNIAVLAIPNLLGFASAHAAATPPPWSIQA